MTRVLVTGYRGLLGATLMKVLPELGFEVTELVTDIRFGTGVKDAAFRHQPKWIIHTAAKTNVPWCEKNPKVTFDVNSIGTENVVEAAKFVAGHARVIYISTCSVFDGVTGNYNENDKPNPTSVYDKSKREGELRVLDYDKGMVLRLNLIGLHPDEIREKNLVEWLCVSFVNDQDVKLYQDIIINPLSAQTASDLIGEIIQKKIHVPVLHIGSHDKMSKAGIGLLVKERIPNYTGNIAVGNAPAGSPKEMWLNTNLAQSLGLKMPNMKDEIARVLG